MDNITIYNQGWLRYALVPNFDSNFFGLLIDGFFSTTFKLLALQGFFLGSWENGYLFSGSWGALVIIFNDLGSMLKVLGI